jgi:hypothetical protein
MELFSEATALLGNWTSTEGSVASQLFESIFKRLTDSIQARDTSFYHIRLLSLMEPWTRAYILHHVYTLSLFLYRFYRLHPLHASRFCHATVYSTIGHFISHVATSYSYLDIRAHYVSNRHVTVILPDHLPNLLLRLNDTAIWPRDIPCILALPRSLLILRSILP